MVLHTNTKLTKKPQKFGEICAINAFTIHQVQASIKVLSVHALARQYVQLYLAQSSPIHGVSNPSP